jgi:Zn ribbon nucleic-acid-binding protein
MEPDDRCLGCRDITSVGARGEFKENGLPYRLCMKCGHRWMAMPSEEHWSYRQTLMQKALLIHGTVGGNA